MSFTVKPNKCKNRTILNIPSSGFKGFLYNLHQLFAGSRAKCTERPKKGILMLDMCLTWWTLMVFLGLPFGVHCLGRTVGSRWLLLPLEVARAPRRAYTIRQHQPWESTRAPPRKKWGLHKNCPRKP